MSMGRERDSIVSMVHASESKAHHCNGSFDFDIFRRRQEAKPSKAKERKEKERCCAVSMMLLAVRYPLLSLRYYSFRRSINISVVCCVD